jgi:hypothetical protein
MTFHSRRRKPGKVTKPTNELGHDMSPRIAVSLPEDDMRRLVWYANKIGKPVAHLVRLAVWAYLLPIASDADKAGAASK